jgi:hypothetical protein
MQKIYMQEECAVIETLERSKEKLRREEGYKGSSTRIKITTNQ